MNEVPPPHLLRHKSLEHLPVATLKVWPGNARTHSKKQIRQIAASIRQFGFTNPVLVDRDNRILAGHARAEAAKLLGLHEVPCLRIEKMSEAEMRAYVIADNKLALNAGWDEELLVDELQWLLSPESGIDISLSGFSIAEVDILIEGQKPEEPSNPEEDRLPGDAPPRCQIGDLWQLV
jgi:hypothetical protein